MSPPPPKLTCAGSYTAGHAWPSANDDELASTSTVNVKLEPLVNLNSRWMAPLPLSAGVPLVDTTDAVPPVRDRVSRLLTASLPNPLSEVKLVELVYVIELAPLLEKPNTAPPDGGAPVMVLPLALMSLRMPKYTFECAARFTPVQVTVAPVPVVVTPLTVQLPPPGSV